MVKSSHGTLQHHHASIISNNVHIQIKILGKKKIYYNYINC